MCEVLDGPLGYELMIHDLVDQMRLMTVLTVMGYGEVVVFENHRMVVVCDTGEKAASLLDELGRWDDDAFDIRELAADEVTTHALQPTLAEVLVAATKTKLH